MELSGFAWNLWGILWELVGWNCKTRFITTPRNHPHFESYYILLLSLQPISVSPTSPFPPRPHTLRSSHKYPWGQWSCHMVKAGWIFRCALALDTAMMKCFMERFQRIGTLSWDISGWNLTNFPCFKILSEQARMNWVKDNLHVWFHLPLWRIRVRQLGWWNSQVNGMDRKHACSKPPTSVVCK